MKFKNWHINIIVAFTIILCCSFVFAIDFSITTEKNGNLFLEGDEIVLTVNISSKNIEEKNGNFSYKIADYYGSIIKQDNFDLVIDENVPFAKQIKFKTDKTGYLTIKCLLKLNNEIRTEKEVGLGILKRLEISTDVKFSLGSGLHAGQQRYIASEDKIYDLYEKSGILLAREELYWEDIEKNKGVLKLTDWQKDFVTSFTKHRINPFIILDYANRYYDEGNFPTSKEAIEGFVNYCKYLVSTFKDKIHYWEIWNEPNIGIGIGWKNVSPKQYANLLKQVYPAIKNIDPSAIVVGGGVAGADLQWIKGILDEGALEFMDAISVHPYCQPASPEDGNVIQRVRDVYSLTLEHGRPLKVWITEVGWSTEKRTLGTNLNQQANYFARVFLLAFANNDIIENLFWYDFQCDGDNVLYNEHNFGILNFDYTPRPSFFVANTLSNLFSKANFESRISTNDDKCYAYLFNRDNKNILALWMSNGKKDLTMDVGANRGMQIIDIMNNRTGINPVNGLFTITIDEEPIFIEGVKKDVKIIPDKVIMKYTQEIKQGVLNDISNVVVEINNPSNQSIKGVLKLQFLNNDSLKTSPEYIEVNMGPLTTKKYEFKILPDSKLNYPKPGKYCFNIILEYTNKSILGRLGGDMEILADVDILLKPGMKDINDAPSIKIIVKNRHQKDNIKGELEIRNKPLDFSYKIPVVDIKQNSSYEGEYILKNNVNDNEVYDFFCLFKLRDGSEISNNIKVDFFAVSLPKKEIKIDGVLDDWNKERFLSLGRESQVESGYNDKSWWKGMDDLSGKVYLMWDKENFYLAVEIRDNVFFQDKKESKIWQGDSIQFAVYPDTEEYLPYWEYGLAFSENRPLLWSYRYGEGAHLQSGKEVKDAKFAFKNENNVSIYEVAISWKDINNILPEHGKVLKFSILVNDNDGKERRGWLEWGSGIGKDKSPYLFNKITLVK